MSTNSEVNTAAVSSELGTEIRNIKRALAQLTDYADELPNNAQAKMRQQLSDITQSINTITRTAIDAGQL